MKSTDQFKKVIQAKLEEMALNDPLFAVSYKKEGKNIDDCITYILNYVQKGGCNGFVDDEIFGQAAHYYDEDKIDIGKPVSCNVVVNHKVELSEDERKEAKEQAIREIVQEERNKLTNKAQATKKPEPFIAQQATLF